MGKTVARLVFEMTGNAQVGEPSLLMRQPALANMVWQLRDALTCEHWIRDDADFVRGQIVMLLRRENNSSDVPSMDLGPVLLSQEKNVSGNRIVEIIFQAHLGCGGKLETEGAEPKQQAGVWQHAGAVLPSSRAGDAHGAEIVELHVTADGNARYPHVTSATLVRLCTEEQDLHTEVLALVVGRSAAVLQRTPAATWQQALPSDDRDPWLDWPNQPLP